MPLTNKFFELFRPKCLLYYKKIHGYNNVTVITNIDCYEESVITEQLLCWQSSVKWDDYLSWWKLRQTIDWPGHTHITSPTCGSVRKWSHAFTYANYPSVSNTNDPFLRFLLLFSIDVGNCFRLRHRSKQCIFRVAFFLEWSSDFNIVIKEKTSRKLKYMIRSSAM